MEQRHIPCPDDKIREAIEQGLDQVCFGVAMDCSAPLFWHRRSKPTALVQNSGTVFFIDAGQGAFAVTARHVLEGYAHATQTESLVCRCSGDLLDDVGGARGWPRQL